MYFANTIRLNCHNKTSKSEIAQLKVEGCFFSVMEKKWTTEIMEVWYNYIFWSWGFCFCFLNPCNQALQIPTEKSQSSVL